MNTQDSSEERKAFEAWARVRYAKNSHFWLRQIDDGGYSCGMADAAWAAWQVASAQPAPITPETGNTPPQGASAITSESVRSGPLLSVMEAVRIGAKHSTGLSHTREFTEEGFLACVAEVEQAMRAKLGAGVPMTDQQISRLYAESWSTSSAAAFHQAVRAAERHHGIVGKEGA